MGRIACLIVRDGAGDFLDPLTGDKLRCCGEGADIQALVAKFCALRDSGVLRRGKSEVKLSEVRLLANNTAGGEFKAGRKFTV